MAISVPHCPVQRPAGRKVESGPRFALRIESGKHLRLNKQDSITKELLSIWTSPKDNVGMSLAQRLAWVGYQKVGGFELFHRNCLSVVWTSLAI